MTQAAQGDGRLPSYEYPRTTNRQFPLHERQRSRPSIEYDIIPASYRHPPPVPTLDEPDNTGRRRARTASSGREARPIPSFSVPLNLAASSYRTPRPEISTTTPTDPSYTQRPPSRDPNSALNRQRTNSAAASEHQSESRPIGTNVSKPSQISGIEDARNERNEKRAHQAASKGSSDNYDVPDSWLNLGDVTETGPVQNVDEDNIYRYQSLEDTRRRDQEYIRKHTAEKTAPEEEEAAPEDPSKKKNPGRERRVSRLATQFYAVSYLIFFSFLGTLARLGLIWLTDYPGAPVFNSVWFNFGGSLVMGFLAEDRMLFRNEWGEPNYERQLRKAKKDEESGGSSAGGPIVDLQAAKKAHLAVKKTIPLYIGLATGFCGSFTSFSSFVRDVFLALSNDLPQPGRSTTVPRYGGYSVMAVLAVIIITVSASLSGLFIGAHFAIASEPVMPSLPFRFTRKFIDPLAVFLAWGCWIGAILLSVMPPENAWRGDATFALVFAPIGTLMRFYVSLWMNGINPAFPVGTFVMNIFGTAILGMAWDLQRLPVALGGVLGCQILQGVEDGLCGCLTTVSTWVSELAALRRRHAWIYGMASVLGALGIMTAIMGGVRWTLGFAALQCTH